MTEDEYYRAVTRLGLSPSAVSTVYLTKDRESHSVPLASRYTPEQRAEIIQKLRRIMGVEMRRKAE